jgi:hypothetical protein
MEENDGGKNEQNYCNKPKKKKRELVNEPTYSKYLYT